MPPPVFVALKVGITPTMAWFAASFKVTVTVEVALPFAVIELVPVIVV